MTPEEIIAVIREKQCRYEHMPCPRCGMWSMDEESPFRNALGRAADVCVCDRCGHAEAYECLENRLKPISAWYAVQYPERFFIMEIPMEKINTTIENMKRIDEMARRNTPLFFMSISHLFDSGMRNFTQEVIDATMRQVEENHRQAAQEGKIPVMTLDYEKAVINQACDLSQLPLFDILLYIKKHMDIHDPQKAILTNIYTGETIGEIDGNIVRTPIGTYVVEDSDLLWLTNEATLRRSFCPQDVKAVGTLVYDE